MISEIESNIIAVERINQYKKTSEEAPWVIQNESVPTDWPNNGEISFVDFKIRYRENLDLVLKGISFFVNGGEKVNLCMIYSVIIKKYKVNKIFHLFS